MTDETDESTTRRTNQSQLAPDAAEERRAYSRWGLLLARLRAHPTGRVVLRIGVAIAGALVIAVGIVLLPLPGPGWAIIFFGIAIWAIEFRWAKRLLLYAKARVLEWRTWYTRQSWPTRILVGAATAIVVLAIIGVALWFSAGPAIWRTLRH
jgi:uncharacterized protein (TIGR02611 family)